MDIEFEKAVRFLAEHLPKTEEGSRKPVLFHDIRVGVYLYEKNYSRDVVLAGLLHDVLEWGSADEETIKQEFGENVLEIIKANTKDRSIENSNERIEELVKHCAQQGKDALIVKAADTLDSIKHYTKTDNQDELDYCRKNAQAILKHKPENFDDPVLNELEKWI